jgi:hypothetical protein
MVSESLLLSHVFCIFSLPCCSHGKCLSFSLLTCPVTISHGHEIESLGLAILVSLALPEAIKHCLSWLLQTLMAELRPTCRRWMVLWT